MLGAGSQKVDAGGVNAAVAEYVGQLGHILAGLIEGLGKQVAEVVWEYFRRRYPRLVAQCFHFSPNLLAG